MLSFIILCIVAGIMTLAVSIFYLLQGAPFVSSSQARTDDIVRTVQKIGSKRLIDLGSGDGQLVIALAQTGVHIDGIEILPWLVWRANRRLKRLKLQGKARIRWGNLWQANLADYDTVVLYAIPHIMPRLEQKILAELPRNAWVVSNYFTFPGLKQLHSANNIHTYQKQR